MDNSAPKKRRIDAVVSQPSSSSSSPAARVEEVGLLPPELWAKVLQYTYFDELITCTVVNKFFLNDVAKQIKNLYIRSGESMDVLPAAIERFSSVESVKIYVIRELVHGIADFHLDVFAMEMIVPFLSRLPSLQLCRLEGKRTGAVRREYITYEVDNEHLYDHPHPDAKWAQLITTVCRAYKTGKISENVSFDGLILNTGIEDHCAWKDVPKLDEYRDDVKCQVCDMICSSFPPKEVLGMTYEFIPCVTFENMAKIVRFRDEENSKSIMTAAIISELENVDGQAYMCPPDYCTNTCFAMTFHDNHFERLECFISNGGDPNDAAVFDELLEKRPCDTFVGNRKIIEKESFDTMKGLGFKLSEDDFWVLDREDKRTSIKHFKLRKAKNQLSSGVAICDIEEICDKVKHMSCGGYVVFKGRYTRCNNLNLENDVMNFVSEWLDVDLSDHEESIKKLISEYRKAGNTCINAWMIL